MLRLQSKVILVGMLNREYRLDASGINNRYSLFFIRGLIFFRDHTTDILHEHRYVYHFQQ